MDPLLEGRWTYDTWQRSACQWVLDCACGSMELRLELTLCAVHARVQTQRVRRLKELYVQNA